jgi:1-acyl-sn-glycerol-3-phosphate acyltransferase
VGEPESAYPSIPEAFRQARGRFWKAAGRAYLKLSGWRVEGRVPAAPKLVAIVAPHTSNWDFLLGVAVLFGLELRVSWLGKQELFRPPFQRFLRWMGGIPVDRRASRGVVGECAAAFEAAPALLLALAPEGTRKGASQWRSGFYQIAVQAGVPLFPVGFDFHEHVVRFLPEFRPTGDLDADLPRIRSLFPERWGLKARPKA